MQTDHSIVPASSLERKRRTYHESHAVSHPRGKRSIHLHYTTLLVHHSHFQYNTSRTHCSAHQSSASSSREAYRIEKRTCPCKRDQLSSLIRAFSSTLTKLSRLPAPSLLRLWPIRKLYVPFKAQSVNGIEIVSTRVISAPTPQVSAPG